MIIEEKLAAQIHNKGHTGIPQKKGHLFLAPEEALYCNARGDIQLESKEIEKFSENLPVEKEGCLIGEFLGIIKLRNISTVILQKHLQQLRKIHKGKFHDAKSFELAKLTDFLQDLVESKVEIDPIFVDGKWCEIDTPKDLELARKQFL